MTQYNSVNVKLSSFQLEKLKISNKKRNWCNLKFVSAIFFETFIFSPNDSASKTIKMSFISSKKLFSFLRYSNFCNFFPSFPHFPDLKGQMEVE